MVQKRYTHEHTHRETDRHSHKKNHKTFVAATAEWMLRKNQM